MKALVWVGGIGAVIVLAVGGWFGYWALNKAGTNNQNVIDRTTNGYQRSYEDTIRGKITDIAGMTNEAQKVAATNQACALYNYLTHAPADIATWAGANCE